MGSGTSQRTACRAIKLNERTFQRWSKVPTGDLRRGPRLHPRKLLASEVETVLAVACLEEYYDLTPPLIVAKLADEGTYVASESTFYRLLRKENLLKHRSRSKKPRTREKVDTIASKPNEVWAWDITNLRTPWPRQFFKLYMFEDLYSRKIVGWDVLATEFDGDGIPVFKAALLSENIDGKDLRLHSDNGNPMRGVNMIEKMLDLGVRASLSRPSVSNDNPHIESLFRIMKYTASYPTKPFTSIESAKAWVTNFVQWYNNHMHSSLGYVTPSQRHTRVDEPIRAKRRAVYEAAQRKNPIRWSQAAKAWPEPELAKLNPYGTRLVS
jgi:putative transposase